MSLHTFNLQMGMPIYYQSLSRSTAYLELTATIAVNQLDSTKDTRSTKDYLDPPDLTMKTFLLPLFIKTGHLTAMLVFI